MNVFLWWEINMYQIELAVLPTNQSALDMAMLWLNSMARFDSISEISFKLNPEHISDDKYYVMSDNDVYEFEDPHEAWRWTKKIDGSCKLIYPGGILVAYK